jgi:peptide/nickel transport system substrate-binding protein
MRRQPARWLFVFVLGGGLAVFTALWQVSSSGPQGSTPVFGGVYVEGVAGTPSRINPIFAAQNEVDRALSALIFSGLTRLDDQGRPYPDLAETWELSQDGRVYLFHLRHGVVWHDGASFSADDVVFTYGLLSSPLLRSSPTVARLLAEASVDKVDRLTVRIELKQPFAPLPSFLSLGILPSHLLRDVGAANLYDDAFNQRPVGTGPFRLDELSGQRAVLTANAAYHFGQPLVQRIEMRFFRDDGALIAALRARELDGALLSPGLSAGDLFYLQQRSDLAVRTLRGGSVTYVYLNLRLPLFQDKRVRQALLYALDRSALAEGPLAGHAVPAESPIVENTWAYSSAFRRYETDARLAGLLLDEAGWKMTERGVRSDGARELTVTLSTNNDPIRVAVTEAVAKRWDAIGVKTRVEVLGATDLLRDLLEPRDYEAVIFAYHTESDPDPYLAWHSTQIGLTGRNLSSLQDGRIDRVLEEARLTASLGRRAELYADFQALFGEELPALPLYASSWTYVHSTSLRGVRLGYFDNAGSRFWQVQEWHLKVR